MTPENNEIQILDAYLQISAQQQQGKKGFQRSWPSQLPVFQAVAAHKHEQVMFEDLAGAQVPESISEGYQNGDPQLFYVTELEQTLSQLDHQLLSLKDKLILAISLTEAVSSLHERDIFHLSLRPSVFLISQDLSQVQIMDLSSARYCAKSSIGINAYRPLFSEAHYLSPEQSYPVDRLLDNRTDLYALGCVLTWLFSGQPPFAHLNGEHEIAYGHISGQPQLPELQHPCVHLAINQLLSLLLEKEADNRYQSCAGVLQDLHKIRQSCLAGESLTDLSERSDISDRLHIPQRLYGREEETAQLLQAFERVAEGPSEALLIGGYSGVGKSALVHEIHKPILKSNGLFVFGKFDQYQRGTPYSALVQAFNHFIRYLLSLPDQEVSEWRQRLNQALQPNGQVLVDLLPELGRLLGPQPELPLLGPEEQQNRFNRTFLQFVHEICVSNKPLVIFIDDLQWADLASINLLHLLLSDADSHYCLILGAYRDNEVDERHPFIRMLAELDNSSRLRQLVLQPLKQPTVQQLIADTVQQQPEQVTNLTQLVYQKTGGNPFFFRQFMQELYQRELLHFDYQDASWHWSVTDIDQQCMTDNVVELMLHKIDRLPGPQQLLLQQAACIGASFSLELLQQLNQISGQALLERLQPIFAEGLLVPVRSHATEADSEIRSARFLHDRVQQAAYSKWSDEARLHTHYQLGCLLLQDLDDDGIEEHCFQLVTHFNQAPHLLDVAECQQVIQLNHRAALKAKAATAYSTAVNYLDQVFALNQRITELAEESRSAESFNCAPDNALLIDASLEKLECLYLAGEYQTAEALKDGIYAQCHDQALKTRFSAILITQYTRYGELQAAIAQGLSALEALEWPLPEQPTMDDIGAAIGEAQQGLQQMPFAELAKQPATTNAKVLQTLDILMAMQPCCYNSGSLLFPLTILGLLKLTREQGNSPYSSYVFMMYGLMCTKVLKDYDTAFEAAHYSSEIAKDYPANPLLEGRLLMMRCNFILPWQKSLQVGTQVRDNAYHQCLDQGDYYWGVHSYIFGFYADLVSTPSLELLLQRTEQVATTCEQIKQPAQVYLSRLQCNLLHILQGTLDNSQNLDHEPGYEQQALQHFRDTHYMCGKYDRLLGRLLQGYLFGNYQSALEVALSPDLAMDDLDEGIFHEAVYTLFNLLCLLAYQQQGQELTEQQQAWQEAAWQKYQTWYQLNPHNFAVGFHLIQAEQHNVDGDSVEAICCYDKAIHYARQSGFALLEALACERSARYRYKQQQISMARAYLEQALQVYQSWGAYAKADEMERLLTQISDQHLLVGGHSLDWQSVLTASQDISQQCSTPELIERVLQRATSATGARRVAFFQRNGDDSGNNSEKHWNLLALCCEGQLKERQEVEGFLPESILNYCYNSQNTLILKDAANVGDYMLEQDIQQRQVRSVMALPLIAHDEFIGVLYLEHNATRNLFTAQKARVMELLAGQFAITYLNTRYYDQLQSYNEQLEATVAERTHQLNKKNQHLEAILQALPIPFVVSGPHGELIEGNERLLQQFEISQDDFIKENARNFYVNEQDRLDMLQQLQLEGAVNDFECQLKTHTDKPFWAMFSAAAIDLDSGKGLFAAIRDITDHKHREHQLHQQANTDPLTGAYNRRAFFDLPLEIRQAHPQASLCIAMLDLDHFKRLNDNYGHAAGDEVLKQFVQLVQESLREKDLLGRVGGEEFALLLTDVTLEQAKEILDRLCHNISELTLSFEEQQIRFTSSGGVTEWQRHESLDEGLNRADRLLYQAKAQGRNQIISDLAEGSGSDWTI